MRRRFLQCLVGGMILVGLGFMYLGARGANMDEGRAPHRVTYYVSGKALLEHDPKLCPPGLEDPAFQEQIDQMCKVVVSLTYANAQEATEQIGRIQAPWSMGFSTLPGQFLYVSAQIITSGSLTCTIFIDGTPVQTATSHGQYTIVTCSGSVPPR